MISETIASSPSPAAHHAFREALPRMSAVIRFNLRGCPRRDREEAMAEVVAAAWAAWEGLLRRGEDPVAVGVTGIAFNACRYVKNGRRLGNRIGGIGASTSITGGHSVPGASGSFPWMAATTEVRRRRARRGRAGWRRTAAGARRTRRLSGSTSRPGWIASRAKRQVAELLASGQTTTSVAHRMGVTAGAVSQWRAVAGRLLAPVPRGVSRSWVSVPECRRGLSLPPLLLGRSGKTGIAPVISGVLVGPHDDRTRSVSRLQRVSTAVRL